MSTSIQLPSNNYCTCPDLYSASRLPSSMLQTSGLRGLPLISSSRKAVAVLWRGPDLRKPWSQAWCWYLRRGEVCRMGACEFLVFQTFVELFICCHPASAGTVTPDHHQVLLAPQCQTLRSVFSQLSMVYCTHFPFSPATFLVVSATTFIAPRHSLLNLQTVHECPQKQRSSQCKA